MLRDALRDSSLGMVKSIGGRWSRAMPDVVSIRGSIVTKAACDCDAKKLPARLTLRVT